MSDPSFWRDRMDFFRKDVAGLDPVTRNPTYDVIPVLEDEPCDLAQKDRRVANQTPQGTIVQMVKEITCKVRPANELDAPDEDDEVRINGQQFKVITSKPFYDAGDGSYHGSRLTLVVAEGP